MGLDGYTGVMGVLDADGDVVCAIGYGGGGPRVAIGGAIVQAGEYLLPQ